MGPHSDIHRQNKLEALKKILRLEQQRRYSDTAVYGGLDRLLVRWTPELGRLRPPTILRELGLPNPGYRAMEARQRQEWLGRLLRLLEQPLASEALPGETARPVPVRPQRTPALAKTRRPVAGDIALDAPIDQLKGVGTTTLVRLRKLGLRTLRDLLVFFPRRHNDFSRVSKVAQLQVGEEQTLVVTVWEARETTPGQQRLRATEAVVGDDTGNLRVIWFNQPYLARYFRPNRQVVLSGRVSLYRGQRVMENPEYELLAGQEELVHTGRLVPVYPLTEGLAQRNVRSLVKRAVDTWGLRLPELLPPPVPARQRLMSRAQAVQQAHYPDTLEAWEQARRRLAFDELFLLQTVVLRRRRLWHELGRSRPIRTELQLLQQFLSALPFSLTEAQHRALKEVLVDMEKDRPMNRLLQGEVGSGKTVVAAAALLMTAVNDLKGVIMAPTEILAEQHFLTLGRLLTRLARPAETAYYFSMYLDPFPRPISVGLLLGSMPKRQKEQVQGLLQKGALDITVGTHALIQEKVAIPDLGMAVVDEQHRFGVMQRASLREKGPAPHLLVMSATPIPRTLALTLYGDLDISVIDQLPGGRQPTRTRVVSPEQRWTAYDFLRQQVRKGRQAFVLCPLIEESEAVQAKAATQEYQTLAREVFPDLHLGLLHGRMPLREKQQVMERFRAGELEILVATPVIEVGIDVPNATVMLVEAADRFGLSQLHQLRGRVGRGQHPGYCLLLADSPSPEAQHRLQALERLEDGFAVAEADLELRGYGDLFGTRQSGLPDLRMARLSDQDLLLSARQEAQVLLRQDPELQDPQHQLLAQEVKHLWDRVVEEVS